MAQVNKKRPQRLRREAERRSAHSRDSLLQAINKSDTSVNRLLQRVEQYTTTFNQINNSLSEGLDTLDVSTGLPPLVKRLNKIDSLTKTHKSSTLRYLFVLRDNLDHIQGAVEDWQGGMDDLNSRLVQNQTELIKFAKDTSLKAVPTDSLLRRTFFLQLKAIRMLWHATDAANRRDLLKINLLQDKLAMSYTKTLDGTDRIDLKIKQFAMKAIAGESEPLWRAGFRNNDFKTAWNSTLKLNGLLFNYFIKAETLIHLAALLFFGLIFSWVIYVRTKTIKGHEHPGLILEQAKHINGKPLLCALLVSVTIVPYFYDHPPVVFLELFFMISVILTLIFLKSSYPQVFGFFLHLFWLTLVYLISNLFIQISIIDRYVIFILSLGSLWLAGFFLRKVNRTPAGCIPYAAPALKIFIALQTLSLLLNISGRFSLAKIIGVTAVFNLWLLIILFLVIQIVIQSLFLQFETKRSESSLMNWVDYAIVQKKFRNILITLASLLWLFFLLQNLNIDDWVSDNISDLLNEPRTVGGASFTLGGFVIFIAVIWVSSMVSRIISYFYDISAHRVNDLSIAKKKNRTSTLLIRLGVFSAGFILAVAASGFPLEKLTIIISAFGIGIGFGLQNIVNNLVSGLILAFEKPIQIGDIVEVDNRSGTMKEIGIRSSKLLTSDGSEVIIPNGDLISRHVVNWTLSNNNRRIELLVNAAYGSDIDKIKGLLKALLHNRDDIMTTPGPSVFLHNVSESSVDFRLFFWAADISSTLELKSKILADIYLMFNREGILKPAPQKDFYLHFPDEEPL